MDKEPGVENGSSFSSPAATPPTITLSAAIDLGEYEPNYLATFPQWHELSTHIQWEFIRKALDIRNRQLITHYAELSNTMNFSQKPALREAMKHIEKQLRQLEKDKEDLYVEYSTKL